MQFNPTESVAIDIAMKAPAVATGALTVSSWVSVKVLISQVTQCYDSPPVQAGFLWGEYGSKDFRCTERRHRKTVQNCTIQLKAKRNSTTVVVTRWPQKIRMKPGVTAWTLSTSVQRYSVGGRIPAVTCRDHHVYEDSQPGTLNDFLGAMTEVMPVRRHCAVLN